MLRCKKYEKAESTRNSVNNLLDRNDKNSDLKVGSSKKIGLVMREVLI
jgi:hypothetical protein